MFDGSDYLKYDKCVVFVHCVLFSEGSFEREAPRRNIKRDKQMSPRLFRSSSELAKHCGLLVQC